MSRQNDFDKLEIWKVSMSLVKDIYELLAIYPKTEVYGLVSQMKRCAISIPSNIAEGFRRKGPKDFIRFLNISLGSLAELETQVLIAIKLEYSTDEAMKEVLKKINYVTAMTFSFIKYLRRSI